MGGGASTVSTDSFQRITNEYERKAKETKPDGSKYTDEEIFDYIQKYITSITPKDEEEEDEEEDYMKAILSAPSDDTAPLESVLECDESQSDSRIYSRSSMTGPRNVVQHSS